MRRCTGYAMHASDDDGNRAALLSDLREYLPERWPSLNGYFNVEVAKYGATSNAVDPPARRAGQALAAPGGLRSGSLTAPDCLRKLKRARHSSSQGHYNSTPPQFVQPICPISHHLDAFRP